MRVRSVVLAISVLAATTALTITADAGERRKLRRLAAPADQYYAGPGFVHRMPGFRVLFGDYALSEEEFDALYGNGEDFDETYYEPKPLVTSKPKPKAKPAAKSTALTTASTGDAEPVAPKPAKPVLAALTAEPPQPGPAPSAALTCGKASTIIEGYGFSGVKPGSCEGKVYAFNATRDGKSFAIKVNAANGELTEVKKLN